MILLSFDIGIKNLAFGVVEVADDHTLKRVFSFGIVNLIPEASSQTQCSVPSCSNRANHSIGRGDKKLIMCGNKRCKRASMVTWNTQYPKSKATIQTYRPKKATTYSLIDMAKQMKEWVQSQSNHWSSIGLQSILLEHQPVFRNPVMKSVEMILVGVLVSLEWSSIHFVHASKKTKTQATYAQRKQASIDLIEEWMQSDTESVIFDSNVREIWNNSRKRDDLADTITQAVAWNQT